MNSEHEQQQLVMQRPGRDSSDQREEGKRGRHREIKGPDMDIDRASWKNNS